MAIDVGNKINTNKPTKGARKIFSNILRALAIIVTVIVILSCAAPYAGMFVGLIGYLIFGAIILVIGCCTLFLIFASEGYRSMISEWNTRLLEIFKGSAKLIDFVKNVYPYLISITGVIVVANLIFAVFNYKFNKEQYKTRFVTAIVIGVIWLIAAIVLSVIVLNSK